MEPNAWKEARGRNRRVVEKSEEENQQNKFSLKIPYET